MKINIQPLYDRIIVRRAKPEEVTPGGIVLPAASQKPMNEGIVEAVGPGLKEEPMPLKVGDKVLFSKLVGTDIKVDGEDFLIMTAPEILGTLGSGGGK